MHTRQAALSGQPAGMRDVVRKQKTSVESETIENIINDLREIIELDESKFALQHTDDTYSKLKIIATTNGLAVCAMELLEAILAFNEIQSPESRHYYFGRDRVEQEGNIYLSKIEITSDFPDRQRPKPEQTKVDWIVPVLFFSLLIFLVLSALVGGYTIIMWILKWISYTHNIAYTPTPANRQAPVRSLTLCSIKAEDAKWQHTPKY